jgi:hypothetical protein
MAGGDVTFIKPVVSLVVATVNESTLELGIVSPVAAMPAPWLEGVDRDSETLTRLTARAGGAVEVRATTAIAGIQEASIKGGIEG